MRTILHCMTTAKTSGPLTSFGLLLFRVALCSGLLVHGIPKIQNFESLSTTFPDPIGTGSQLALYLVILAEVICSVPVILGLFTRIAVLPPIIMMIVAVFIQHANDPFSVKEPALFYLCGYSLLFFTGPGWFSLDGFFTWLCSRKQVAQPTETQKS